jgi:hypothetical protein
LEGCKGKGKIATGKRNIKLLNFKSSLFDTSSFIFAADFIDRFSAVKTIAMKGKTYFEATENPR